MFRLYQTLRILQDVKNGIRRQPTHHEKCGKKNKQSHNFIITSKEIKTILSKEKVGN